MSHSFTCATGNARLCIVALLALGLIAATTVRGEEAAEVRDPDPARWTSTIENYAARDAEDPPPRGGVLFVGSSTIRGWPLAESFPDLPAIGRGVGGSQISDLNHWFDALVPPYQPRVIVFYAGDNDIANCKGPERVADDFRRFAERVSESVPEARIVFLAIKPSVRRWALWPKMAEANALIAAYADEHAQVDFVDVATPMLDESGEVNAAYLSNDGLHLSREGYELWTGIVAPVLAAEKLEK